MDRSTHHLTKFQRVIHRGDFSLLSDYEDVGSWADLSTEERELLGLLFSWRGDRSLSEGRMEEAERSFALAPKLAPQSLDVRYWQGVAWLKKGVREDDPRALERAVEEFELVVSQDVERGLAWQGLAQAQARLGRVDLSEQHFRRAEKLVMGEELAQLYWDWGLVRAAQAQASGEAYDYHLAAELFALAQEKGLDRPSFWLDYGNVQSELARLLGEPNWLERALRCYARTVEAARGDRRGWLAIGRTFKHLYHLSGRQEHFVRARDCLQQAVNIDGKDSAVWLEWAELLYLVGERENATEYLEEALERLECAETTTPETIALGIRILLRLGLLLERLDMLRDAESRARKAVAQHSTSGLLWVRLADAFAAQASYFNDEDLYRRAAEKYAYALTLESELNDAHLGMAEVCYALGLMREDETYIEKAAQRASLVASREKLEARAWHLWGVSLLRLSEGRDVEQAKEAVDKLSRAVALRGGIDGGADYEWVLDYGCALDQLAMAADDEATARRAVQVLSRLHYLQPDDLDVRFRLGQAWLHVGELMCDRDCFVRSLEHFEAIAVHDPDDEVVWDEWGHALLCLARLIDDPHRPEESNQCRADAEAKLRRAVSLGSHDALYHLACLHAQVHRGDLAAEFLRKAAQMGGLPPLEAVIHDEWLTPIRDSDPFRAFLREASEREIY